MIFCIITIKRKQVLGKRGLLRLDFVLNAREIQYVIEKERSKKALGVLKCEY